jgi:hypothetical protein
LNRNNGHGQLTWLPPQDLVIIHGGAKGADTLADQWAITNWVKIEEYKPNWEKHGKAAGPIRNKQMLDEGKPDLVIALRKRYGEYD